MAQPVRPVRHDAQVGGGAGGIGKRPRVVDGNDVVGAAVYEEPRPWHDARGRSGGIEPGDRADPTRAIARVLGSAQHAGAARVFEKPLGIAHPRLERGGRGEGRNPAYSIVVGGGHDRECPTEPEPRDPHTREVDARVQCVDRGTHVGKPSSDREVAFGRTCPAKRESQTRPTRLACDPIAQCLVGVADRRRTAGPARKTGEHEQRGHTRQPRRPREVRAEPQAFRNDFFHPAVILARVTAASTNAASNATTPALKEWASIVHALLEGEQIVDVRKGGLHEDGRHFDLPARRFWLSPTAEHQKPGLLKPAYAHWIDLATASPVGEPIAVLGWADVVDVATITEPEQVDALDSKLIWTRDYVASRFNWKRPRPVVGARHARATDCTSRWPCNGGTTMGAARRG